MVSEQPQITSQRVPFLPIDQAVTPDLVTCLACGKTGKTLRGHLRQAHNLDVNAYREMFGLPQDFPLVAPSYSEKRLNLAKQAGLGQKMRKGRKKNYSGMS